MTKMKETGLCCLCGGEYDRWGNNPYPLADLRLKGERCCDACNEIVIEARLDPKGFEKEFERVELAMVRVPKRRAMAAICASRGPVLLIAKRQAFGRLMAVNELIADDPA
jgi:hypothetical protein